MDSFRRLYVLDVIVRNNFCDMLVSTETTRPVAPFTNTV